MMRRVWAALAVLCTFFSPALAQEKPEVFPQLGHSLSVLSVAFSPDGQLLASSGDLTVKLWDVASGRELRTFTGHTSRVTSVAFSPDGKVLASISDEGTIKVWDAASGREVWTMPGQAAPALAVVTYSPDGRLLASAGGDKTIKIWDAASGKVLRRLAGHSDGVSALAFSPDGRVLASGGGNLFRLRGRDNTIKLWDPASGRPLRTFRGHADSVSSLAFSPDGKLLASSSMDKTVTLWEVAGGRELPSTGLNSLFTPQSAEPISLAFSPDGRLLALGSTDHTVKLWDMQGQRELRSLAGHSGPVDSIAFSRDGKLLASGSSDNSIKLWDVASGGQLHTLGGVTDWIWSVAVSPDGRTLASGTTNNLIRLWDVASGHELRVLRGHSKWIKSVAFSPDGRVLASGSFDGTVKLWDMASGRELASVQADSEGVFSVAFSPDGAVLASAGYDHTIKLWDMASGRELRTLSGHADVIYAIAFSADGKRIVSGSGDGTIRIWDVASGRQLRNFGKHSGSVRFGAMSPDGRTAAAGLQDGTIELWDADSGRLQHTLGAPSRMVTSIAFSPDGRVLASSSEDRIVKLWDVASGVELRTLQGHDDWVWSVAFLPDGKMLASGGADGELKLWDTASGKARVSLIAFLDGSFLAITPEGYYDASAAAAEDNLNVRVGGRVFPIAAYRDTFYRPDLVKLSLAGNSLIKLGFSGLDSVKVAPVVDIVDVPSSTSNPELTINLRLADAGGGIGRVLLFHNGTAVRDSGGAGSPSPSDASATRSFTIDLVDGPNVLQAEAYNAANTMHSDSAIAKVLANLPPKSRSNLHAVVVGIQEFKNPNFNLAYPVKDAKLFADTLSSYSAKLFQNVDIKLLITPADTTRENLIKTLKDMQPSVGPDDLFVLYIASHGVTDDAEYYLITSNVGSASSEHLKTDAVSKEELTALVANIHATKKLMVIDTCHAEALGNALQVGLLTRGLDEITALKVLSRAVGTTVLAASTTTQQALEGYEGHGLFTYVVAQGLMGNGDADANGIVNTLALAHYVDDRVPELAQQHFNHPQYPTVETNGQAFPLTMVR